MVQQALRTGVRTIDRKLNGGIPAGGLVAYTADPATQSELFLYEVAAERETLYITTTRTEQLVEDTFDAIDIDVSDTTVRYVPPDASLDAVLDLVLEAQDSMTVIVDTADALERSDRLEYQRFLNRVLVHLKNIDGIAIFHCPDSEAPPENRGVTTAMAEIVLDLSTDTSGAMVETRLAISKFRSGEALTETVKLSLTDRVRVDTSRDIA